MNWVAIVYYSGWIAVGILMIVVTVMSILSLEKFSSIRDITWRSFFRDAEIRNLHWNNFKKILPWIIALLFVAISFLLLIGHIRSNYQQEWTAFMGDSQPYTGSEEIREPKNR
jgi:hypothetical protein